MFLLKEERKHLFSSDSSPNFSVWYIHIILRFRRLGQEDHEIKVMLGYITRSWGVVVGC